MAARRKYGELRYSRLGRGRVQCLEQHPKRAEEPSSMRLYRASQSRAKQFLLPSEKKLERVEVLVLARTEEIPRRSIGQRGTDL